MLLALSIIWGISGSQVQRSHNVECLYLLSIYQYGVSVYLGRLLPVRARVRVLACIENNKFPIPICVSRTESEREKEKKEKERETLLL